MSSNNTNLIGEFYAMSRLFLQGYEPTLTLGNTKGIDILLFNPKNNKQFKVEVKTSRTVIKEKIFDSIPRISWVMNEKHEKMGESDIIFCFVYVDKINQYRIFFVPAKDVAEWCYSSHQIWSKAEHKKEVNTETKIRRFMINFDRATQYENNFSIFD